MTRRGRRLSSGPEPRGSVVGDIPPENTLTSRDIRATGATSISELLDSIASQTGSARGRGGGRPILLLNGQRISGFPELRDLPPEAIERMEILPEEVALKYGYVADQRVVNIVLRRRFNSTSAGCAADWRDRRRLCGGHGDATRYDHRRGHAPGRLPRRGQFAASTRTSAISLQPRPFDAVDPRPFRTAWSGSAASAFAVPTTAQSLVTSSATVNLEASARPASPASASTRWRRRPGISGPLTPTRTSDRNLGSDARQYNARMATVLDWQRWQYAMRSRQRLHLATMPHPRLNPPTRAGHRPLPPMWHWGPPQARCSPSCRRRHRHAALGADRSTRIDTSAARRRVLRIRPQPRHARRQPTRPADHQAQREVAAITRNANAEAARLATWHPDQHRRQVAWSPAQRLNLNATDPGGRRAVAPAVGRPDRPKRPNASFSTSPPARPYW